MMVTTTMMMMTDGDDSDEDNRGEEGENPQRIGKETWIFTSTETIKAY